ncbi:hypothetical protein CERSUDRAFT_92265 [Gelatoporia subvermispora B]|uniref:Arrestin-like N-terminal domain-containing protein n=1 Tax=Ceriporiopsis subvermispora (strain B) TaxID=914234 RepID=M2RMS8_CERS8|nr:hypothetical protein CERSUDRAFT_92265 [Gelatoporia subvermispora B]
MRHPFANPQYCRNSLSTDVITGHRDPYPTYSEKTCTLRAEPPVRAASTAPGIVGPRKELPTPPAPSARTSPTHFVKHSSRVTLLLSGQEEGTAIPIYNSGSTIDGILATPRSSGLLSLVVKIEGVMKLKEVAGSGASESDIISSTVFVWDSQRHASFPSKVSFRYTLPTHYADSRSGTRFLLPPTYNSHLCGIPGFTVDVSYHIVVNITQTRDKSTFWQKSSSLRVPFIVRTLTCPIVPGPFPLMSKSSAPSPQTLFTGFAIQPRRRENMPIKVQIFLPSAQICSMKEPIPFFITLFGDEDMLEPFAAWHPSASSFHPISPTPYSAGALQQQLFLRSGHVQAPPIKVHLQRTTLVDAGVDSSCFTKVLSKSYMMSTKAVGQGAVHHASVGRGALTWAGTIILPSDKLCGGFLAQGLRVSDSIVFSISAPDCGYSSFCESVPVRLTTESYGCVSAVPVSDPV